MLARAVAHALTRMPALTGRPIRLDVRPHLTAHKGKLLSRSSSGTPVYAGSMLAKRIITLDECLLRTPNMLARIFVHEIFHFVWWRLGNPARLAFEEVLRAEWFRRVKGELGWSAESLKLRLADTDVKLRNRRWRMYVCESFCDTGGYTFGSSRQTVELTLDHAARPLRRKWMLSNLLVKRLSV